MITFNSTLEILAAILGGVSALAIAMAVVVIILENKD